MVEMKMRNGVNHINKFDLLNAYPLKQTKPETIKIAAGLIPFEQEKVISNLNIRLTTPNRPTPSPSRGSGWDPKTPSNYIQSQKTSFVDQRIASYRIKKPLEPAQFCYKPSFESLLDHYAIRRITGERSERLRAENEKEKANAS